MDETQTAKMPRFQRRGLEKAYNHVSGLWLSKFPGLGCRCPGRMRIPESDRENLNFKIQGYESEHGYGCRDSAKCIQYYKNIVIEIF